MFLKLMFENISIGLCAQGPIYVVIENPSLEHKVQSSYPLYSPSTVTITQLLGHTAVICTVHCLCVIKMCELLYSHFPLLR